MDQLDWNLARAFLVTAQTGSFSSAARRLGLTQPTLSRQVASFEDALGVLLFDRVGKTLALTEAGSDLLVHIEGMGEAARDVMLTAVGRAQSIEGRVTISASDALCAYLLPSVIARIRERAPGITLRVVSSNTISDLRRREADIAIRHVRPDEPDLIGKLVHETDANFYAAQDWVARHGVPSKPKDIEVQELLCYGDAETFAEHLRALGVCVNGEDFRLSSDSWVAIWEMVKGGLGVGIMARDIAERTRGIVRLLPDLTLAPIPMWLVTHRELKTSRRIRLVFDLLTEELGRRTSRGERASANSAS